MSERAKIDPAWIEVARNAGRQDRDHEIRRLEGEVARLKRELVSLYGIERMRFAAVRRLREENKLLNDEIVRLRAGRRELVK